MSSLISRAKINLCLHVVGKRPDGFHQLQSLVTFAQFGDELSVVDYGRTGNGDKLQIQGEFASQLANDETNLIMRALKAFRRQWPNALGFDISLLLTKNLPIASGVGGGSANAASLLKLVSEISSIEIDPRQLHKLALGIGSDMPVCLLEKPAMMAGRGEVIVPLENFPTLFAVLVNPGIAVSTGKVFASLGMTKNPALPDVGKSLETVDGLVSWLHRTRNDLEGEAIKMVPEIGQIIERFQGDVNCLFARMCGSGATVFALFDNMEKAEKGAVAIRRQWPQFWVQPTVLMGSA